MSTVLSRTAAIATSLVLASICAATAAVPAPKLVSQKAAQPKTAALTTGGHGMTSVKSSFLRSHKFSSKKTASHKFASAGADGKKH